MCDNCWDARLGKDLYCMYVLIPFEKLEKLLKIRSHSPWSV